MTRYIALDLETTSLDTTRAFPLEVAAVEVFPDDPGVYGTVHTFVPHHERSQLIDADPQALSVNRYYERRLYDLMSSRAETERHLNDLVDMLAGSTIVGANPAYDAAVLWRYLVEDHKVTKQVWHHRLYDVEVATAAALGLDSIPGLAKCAALLDLDTDTSVAHTAAGDAFLAADVFTAVYHKHRTDDVLVGSDYGTVQ